MSKKFILREDGSMLTADFRVSFPNIISPNNKGQYGVAMIFDADTDFSVLEKVIAEKKKAIWPKGVKGVFMEPILDGDKSQAQREELIGKFYINAKANKYRPGLVDAQLQEITDEAEFYPGCWARAVVTIYNWTHTGKNGISVNVRNIQKIRDDEPLISRARAADEFESVEDQEVADL